MLAPSPVWPDLGMAPAGRVAPLTVLHVTTGVTMGGAEMMLYRLLARGHRDRFASAVLSLLELGAVGARISALEVPLLSLGMRQERPLSPAMLRLIPLARSVRASLIQGWMYHGNLAAQLAAALTPKRAPVVWNIRGSSHNLKDEKVVTAAIIRIGARLSGLPKVIINNSLVSAIKHEEILGYRSDRRVVIPNGFDTGAFVPSPEARDHMRSELGIARNALLIGLIARYHPVKDHANFLRAAGLLLKDHPEARFVLAGEGVDPCNKELSKLIDKLSITGRVHLLGERNDMSRVAAALDIATSSSSAEAFPNVIGEAMSCGVPCVATDAGDSAFIIGGTGRLVPPRNSGALAAAWRELIEMGEGARRKLGEEARQRVLENFSIEAIAKSYESLYQQVTSSFENSGVRANVRYRWFC